ncbi:hypothetical protein G6F57_014972 [Rhizopus arrhizus]|nr:hypothetical protein G6F57_014972 [Rhizopus arrhizus]
MLSSSTLTTNAAVQTNLKYDVVRSFAPVAMLARSPMALVVGKDSPYQSMADLLAVGRKEPGKLTYGSAGLGSVNQMASEILAGGEKTSFTHVPYKGAAPAIQELLGGQVDVMFIDLASGLPNVKAGKLRVLAAATPERVSVLPDTPTMAEQGVANFTAYAWQGLVGPAGVPEAVVKKLSADLDATLKTPAVSQKMLDMGVIPMPMSAQDCKAYAEQERSAWADVIKKANIKLE